MGFFIFLFHIYQKKEEKKHLIPIVREGLESTLYKLVSMFQTLLERSSTNIKLDPLNENDFKAICAGFNPTKHSSSSPIGFSEIPIKGIYYPDTDGIYLVSGWFQVLKEVENLEKIILIFNDEEIMAILLELKPKLLTQVFEIIIKTTHPNLDMLESILIHIFKITKKISKYHKDNIDNSYVDPFENN